MLLPCVFVSEEVKKASGSHCCPPLSWLTRNASLKNWKQIIRMGRAFGLKLEVKVFIRISGLNQPLSLRKLTALNLCAVGFSCAFGCVVSQHPAWNKSPLTCPNTTAQAVNNALRFCTCQTTNQRFNFSTCSCCFPLLFLLIGQLYSSSMWQHFPIQSMSTRHRATCGRFSQTCKPSCYKTREEGC